MQGTRFRFECLRFRHSQFSHHERNLNIVTPYHFQRDLEKKQIQVVRRVKQYGLVFDKRVIDVATQSSYRYGYERIGDDLDLLLDL